MPTRIFTAIVYIVRSPPPISCKYSSNAFLGFDNANSTIK